ncbi:MAG TPA: hypothetical protein DEF12_01785 [Rhodobacteraceae bacterium]|nr:hypothetical protein [Paracoccaceae bacterium]HBV53746.1 hypothetical protein [Paracoccaceae bacterium]
MKPNFALNLTFDGIGLLHRVPSGWHLVGEVSLEAEDLGAALNVLRKTAAQIDPSGLRTKLVIPNEQIKFITVASHPHAGEAEVRAALDGTTPYALDDLAYDWTLEGGVLHIAAVVRETLGEAENFALIHGFNPVSFVATPDQSLFPGEPFFGLTACAPDLLKHTETVARDLQPIKVIGMAHLPSPQELGVEEEPQDAQEAGSEDETADASAAETTEADGLGVEDAIPEQSLQNSGDEEPPEEASQTEIAPEAEEAPGDDLISEAPPVQETGEKEATLTPLDATEAASGEAPAAEAETPKATFASIRARRSEMTSDSDGPRATIAPTRAMTAPGLPQDGKIPSVAMAEMPNAGPKIIATPDVELSQASSRARASLTPSVSAGAQTTASPKKLASAGAILGTVSTLASQALAATSGIVKSLTLSNRAVAAASPSETGPAMAKATPPATSRNTRVPQTEKERMTVFGARKTPKAAQVGGKPRYLGLALTAVLLLFLAGVAAWASLGGSDKISWFFGGQSETVIASLPGQDEITADELAEEGDPSVTTVSAVALDETQTESNPALIPGLSVPEVNLPTPEEAAARYAATGIWEVAPEATQAPAPISLDDLYLTSIDPAVVQRDAVALPNTAVVAPDVLPGQQPSPAAAGTRFVLNARGLVEATAEGALTPDGVRVFAGRPVAVPPAALVRRETETETAAAAVVDARLASFRPRVRPEGLAEAAERTALGGLTRSELLSKRPRLRPAALEQAIAADRIRSAAEAAANAAAAAAAASTAAVIAPPSAEAVTTSVKPKLRPKDLATETDSAQRQSNSIGASTGSTFTREEVEDDEGETRVASVAPKAVQPKVPSQANVAKAATEKNVLNLSQVNLIGVYGTPQSRRALVRLANGRFQKVKVGDRVDGGRVVAISDAELRYQKGGRNVVLKMPRG